MLLMRWYLRQPKEEERSFSCPKKKRIQTKSDIFDQKKFFLGL